MFSNNSTKVGSEKKAKEKEEKKGGGVAMVGSTDRGRRAVGEGGRWQKAKPMEITNASNERGRNPDSSEMNSELGNERD